jgi:hypothetical protein
MFPVFCLPSWPCHGGFQVDNLALYSVSSANEANEKDDPKDFDPDVPITAISAGDIVRVLDAHWDPFNPSSFKSETVCVCLNVLANGDFVLLQITTFGKQGIAKRNKLVRRVALSIWLL